MNYDLIVIGSGPGGYVAAIRGAQLGLNVAVVERAEQGGICLNWGCIPTKSLLKSAQVLEYAQHAEAYGIKIEKAEPDFNAIITRSRGVADKMCKGIQYLFKKNNITVIAGTGKLTAQKQVEVTNAEGVKNTYEARHIILATGARSRILPAIPQDGKRIIGYREALTLSHKPASLLVVGSGAIWFRISLVLQCYGHARHLSGIYADYFTSRRRRSFQTGRPFIQKSRYRRARKIYC